MGRNDEGGLPKYVIGTLIFFVNIAVWLGIAWLLGLAWWVYIFAVVFGVIMAAVAVWYLQPKDEWK
jgi:membrane associated rhomboid family serine protease